MRHARPGLSSGGLPAGSEHTRNSDAFHGGGEGHRGGRGGLCPHEGWHPESALGRVRLPSDGFSIKPGVRVISKAILKEISLVIFPANPLAAVTALNQGEDESSPLVSLIKWI
jgi:hypothetical protein